MKLVNRYHLWASLECQHFSKAEAVLKFSAEEDGMWVQWQDYASLKEEVERLRASSFVTAVPVEEYEKLKAERDAAKRCWDSMKEEWDKLVDENERLRKAGDAVSICLEAFWKGKPYDTPTIIKCFDGWNAAKDGKPSV